MVGQRVVPWRSPERFTASEGRWGVFRPCLGAAHRVNRPSIRQVARINEFVHPNQHATMPGLFKQPYWASRMELPLKSSSHSGHGSNQSNTLHGRDAGTQPANLIMAET